MFAPSYLSLSRHNIYYIRCPIPKHLHPQRKATDIRLSLQTRCPREALRHSRHLVYLIEHITEWAEMTGIEYSQIRQAISAYFQERIELMKLRLDKEGALSEERQETWTNSLEIAEEAIAGNNLADIYSDQTVLDAADTMGLVLKTDTPDFKMFRSEYMKGARDFFKAVLDYNKQFDSYLFGATSQSANKTIVSPRSLAEMIKLYMDEKLRNGEWRPQTAKGFKSQFDLLQEYLGAGASLSNANQKAHQVYTDLLKLPKQCRSNPKHKPFSIPELLEREHSDCMSAKNVQKYIQAYSAFMDWANALGYVEGNSYKPLIKKSIKGKDKNPFTPNQIRTILEYVQSTKINKDYQRWGVLLGIYTGARLNEIAQLELNDVKQQDGIHYLEITDTGDSKKSLKNAASKRMIPLHSQLIQLGFLEYVEQLRRDGKSRIFHELNYDRNNGYGRNLGRWFNKKLLPNLGMKSGSLTFHSFRHSMTTTLLQAGVEEAIVKSVIGHAKTGVTHKVYGKAGYKLSQLKEAIEMVTFCD